MNSIRSDEHVAPCGVDVTACSVEEIGGNTTLVLAEGTQPAPRSDRVGPEPLLDGLVDHELEAPPVDGELRDFEAGLDAAGLAPDLLAEPVGVDQLIGSDGHLIEALQKAELLQLLDGVRERVDADTEFPDRVRLLVDISRDPLRVKH